MISLSACWLVGRSVKLHFHAPIGALVAYVGYCSHVSLFIAPKDKRTAVCILCINPGNIAYPELVLK